MLDWPHEESEEKLRGVGLRTGMRERGGLPLRAQRLAGSAERRVVGQGEGREP